MRAKAEPPNPDPPGTPMSPFVCVLYRYWITYYCNLRKKFFTEKEKKTLGANIDQFFSSYLSIDAQTVFKQDVFNEILINYLDIITELRSEHINIKLDQWIYFCSHMKYPEISRYTSILKEK